MTQDKTDTMCSLWPKHLGLEGQGIGMDGQVDINEGYLTVAEVAELLKINEETARRLFLNEPDVIVICFPRIGRRVYRTLRIPERVFKRVVTRFTRLA